ncbi:hypothetical protein ACXYL9_02115 [Qipengyuania sp. CAU 1752]
MSVLGLGLAGILMLQAMSGFAARRAPDLATSVMSGNGEATDRLAFARFLGGVSDPENPAAVAQSAQLAAPLARQALAIEPLSTRSLTVIGLAETDLEQQSKFLALADKINRRDISLQGVRLGNQVAAEDFDGVFDTVDRILRAGPEFSDQFFPVVLMAFREERGVARLFELSEGNSPWLNRFLIYAVREGSVLEELAAFRSRANVDDEQFDNLLISSLTKRGYYDLAQDLYRRLTAKAGDAEQIAAQPLGWHFRFSPFGWLLADRSGFRAQPAKDGDGIDINVGAGEDGVLAERVIAAPGGSFGIAVNHDIKRPEQLRYFRLLLHCGDISKPFFQAPMVDQRNSFKVGQAPQGCDFVHVALYARVFSTQPPLRGHVSEVALIDG